ncbi:hypothetical protein TNCV_451871 [Trichonephila clavipes]|nr:hypothetical protein TNCV_451871 [Trichonephila clavipes]
MTVYDNEEVNTGEVECEVQLLIGDLIRESLKFATSKEQYFITHNLDIDHAFKFLRKLVYTYIAEHQKLYSQLKKSKRETACNKKKRKTASVDNERNFSFESNLTVVQDISDTFTDDNNFDPIQNKSACLLSGSDE